MRKCFKLFKLLYVKIYFRFNVEENKRDFFFDLNSAGVTNVYNLNYMKVNDSEKKKKNSQTKIFEIIITIIEIKKKKRDKLKCIKFLICILL